MSSKALMNVSLACAPETPYLVIDDVEGHARNAQLLKLVLGLLDFCKAFVGGEQAIQQRVLITPALTATDTRLSLLERSTPCSKYALH
jgi:hypothetical protein